MNVKFTQMRPIH